MKKLIAQLDGNYFKIDNAPGAFMPLVIKKVSDRPDFVAVYALAHFDEQGGKLEENANSMQVVENQGFCHDLSQADRVKKWCAQKDSNLRPND